MEPRQPFHGAEPKFNLLAKSVVAQIHISTTKDPETGLYMVPAASYVYDVFENNPVIRFSYSIHSASSIQPRHIWKR